MISAKLAVLMAAFALVGSVIAVPTNAFAFPVLEEDGTTDESQNAEVEIERNNEIEQSIEQSQEACTNEAEVSVSDDDVVDIGGENEAEVEQSNECVVDQSQSAANVASIDDNSINVVDVSETTLAATPDADVFCVLALEFPDLRPLCPR
jgi:hypothetical protein